MPYVYFLFCQYGHDEQGKFFPFVNILVVFGIHITYNSTCNFPWKWISTSIPIEKNVKLPQFGVILFQVIDLYLNLWLVWLSYL